MMGATHGGVQRLRSILVELNRQGSFPLVVLTDRQGLPLACDPEESEDAGEQAAVVSLLQGAIDRSGLVEAGDQDEFAIRMRAGRRLICRNMTVDGDWLLLALLVPKGRSYRRLTNRAIREIQRVWEQM